ncbi:MAG TPA: hypothetical protein VJN43_00960 [Bryobacteraceae bacterium]|nr:hypothetical protein [Bryobacteraceae bacterium]
MFLFHLFRSFLPARNPIGFGASDFIEFAFGALLALLALAGRPWIERYGRKLAERTAWCMLALAMAPVALRLLLLPNHPVPTPTVSDEFSHLLVADTLLHFRLANPSHPLHEFFETYFVLQQPTYSSIYSLGQGMVLAIGRLMFGHPWAGVALAVACMCCLCYWMLRAWTSPLWALAGGALAVIEFGPHNQWMNTYWGGAVAATGGCLVFGALPRLRENWRTRDAALLGLGLALHLLTRPYESIFLAASVLLFFAPALAQRVYWRKLARSAAIALLVLFPSILLTLAQNKQITGNWTTLPYMLSRYQYGVPTTFTFQPNPVPHRELTPEQQSDYQVQTLVHGNEPETLSSYFARLGSRVRFYRFFFLAPLYLALPFFLPSLRAWRFLWVSLTLILFALGANFYPYFYPHYIAAVTGLFVLVSVNGLERLSRWTVRGFPVGLRAAWLILLLCAVHFAFWYGVHLFDDQEFLQTVASYETWDLINHGDPQGRIAVNRQLAAVPGRQLVFVRYWPRHLFEEWVHNPADIDSARIVWARDLGASENEKLLRYYPDRTPWLLEPDARPPRLTRYPAEPVATNPFTAH